MTRVDRVDLDAAERVINRPHVIDLRDDGWTVMHPPACHPDLFGCPVNQAATRDLTERPPQAPGRYECALHDGRLTIGDPAPDAEGMDWIALVAELRAARKVIEAAQLVSTRGVAFDHLLRALAAYDEAVGS